MVSLPNIAPYVPCRYSADHERPAGEEMDDRGWLNVAGALGHVNWA